MEEGAVTLWLPADDSSKQELQNSGSGRVRLSFTPSQSLQGDMVMGEPHSLLAMYVSAEQQNFDHEGKNRRRSQHVVNLQTTETSYGLFIHHKATTHNNLLFTRRKVKRHEQLSVVH